MNNDSPRNVLITGAASSIGWPELTGDVIWLG